MRKQTLYPYWDPKTYCTRELFEEVTVSLDLRKVWSYASLSRVNRKISLTIDDILSVCVTHCPICNSELDYGLGENNHQKGDIHTPSLDKLIPGEAGGKYTRDNIWVICERCNRLKNSAHGEQDAQRLETLAKILRNHEYARQLVEKLESRI
jgi:5-methylcytosine-specific restriction endonuclease McrA